jgi:hypothetical protein
MLRLTCRATISKSIVIAALAAVAVLVMPAVTLHAQDPLVRTTASLRNSVIVAGQNIGIVAFVFGFIGMMWPGHNHQEKLMWLMIGGAGTWGVTAIIDTFIR